MGLTEKWSSGLYRGTMHFLTLAGFNSTERSSTPDESLEPNWCCFFWRLSSGIWLHLARKKEYSETVIQTAWCAVEHAWFHYQAYDLKHSLCRRLRQNALEKPDLM
jgi:hypothetical protein